MQMILPEKEKLSSYSIYLVFFLWTLFLRIVSKASSTDEAFANVPVYLLGYCAFIIGSVIFSEHFKHLRKISLLPFLISILPILGTEPLFENDHYRYLWEGQVFRAGFNPYLIAPANEVLSHVESSFRHLVGYNLLTSPYSPFAILFYSLFSYFKYDASLVLLQFVSGIAVWWVLVLLLPRMKTSSHKFIIPVTLLFIKEFVQSVHIDILCFIPFLISLLAYQSAQPFKGSFFIFVSLMVKITPIIFVPAIIVSLLYSAPRKIQSISFLVIGLGVSVIVLYLVGFLDFSDTSGIKAFANHWVWNGGMITPLIFAGVDPQKARLVSAFLLIVSLGAALLFYVRYKKHVRYGRRDLTSLIFASYLFVTFFSPVSNPWYAIWLVVPALLIGNNLGVIYSLFLPLSYLHFLYPQFSLVVTSITHVWFFLSLFIFLKSIYGQRLIFLPKEAL